MRNENVKRTRLFFILLLCMTITGCRKSQPDHYVLVKNAKEIKPEAKVMWQGIHIGSVTDVEIENGKVRIDFDLFQKYMDALRVGVKAKVMNDYSSPSTSVLRLFGGDNPSMPLLEKYSQIQEASFFDTLSPNSLGEWLWTSHAKWCILTCVAFLVLLVILVKLLKGIIRFGIIILLLCLIVISLYVIKNQWHEYNSSPSANYTEIITFIEHSLKNNETRQIWESVKAEVIESMKKSSETGIDHLGSVKTTINQLIQQKIDVLRLQEKRDVVDEIKRDQSTIIDFLSNDE